MATDLRRPPASIDPGSFERFYRRHLGEIYRYVLRDVGNRADAEEVTQAAFLDAYRALRRGHEPERPRAWMYGIARNAARRRYRSQSRRPREVELGPDLADRLAEEEEPQEFGAIRSVIAGLRPSHREVVFLREVEGLSYAEIAKRMRLSDSAVETLLFRARRSLRELLEAEGLRPAVRAGRVKSLRSVLVLPALLGRLAGKTQQLFAPELATKAAGAVTAVALSAGVVVGAQKVPVEAATSPNSVPRTVVPSSTPSASLAFAPRLEREAPSAAAPAKRDRERGERKPDRREGKRSPDGQGSASTGPDSGSGAGGGSGGQAVIGGAGSPGVSTPSVNIPAVEVPSVNTPVASTPEVSPPAVEVPPVSVEVPVEVPPVTVEVPDTDGLLGG